MHSHVPPFLNTLTLDALAAWAGEAVFKRGLAYHKAGRVRNCAQTPEGALLATVDGTRKYATLLFQNADSNLASVCTCPYGARCKHAIALACVGLGLLAENTPPPLADATDRRLLDLEITVAPDDDIAQLTPAAMQELEASLKKHSKAELVTIVINAVSLFPEVASLCTAGGAPTPKNALSLVKEARKALRKALEVPDWGDYWVTPDYEPVRKKLEVLRMADLAEEVLDIGFELIEDSIHQIEMCDDEGETQGDIARCMPTILQALRDVGWPVHKKLLWAVDAILTDEFAVCDIFWDILRENHAAEAWSPVADALLHRIGQCRKEGFVRHRLIEMAAHTLVAAGRESELYALYSSEALEFGEYPRLVKYLLEKGNDKEAEEWIHKGIAATKPKESYTDGQLRSCLLELRKKRKDWDAVLCMQTEDFVHHATLDHFHECRHSAEKLKAWPVLRSLLMDFLIKRTLPWKQDTWPCRNKGKTAVPKGENHSDFKTLIDLAIYEKNPADVLRWYDLQSKSQREFGYGYAHNTDRVATAVQEYAPDRAIALWKQLAEQQIAIVNPRAYAEAGTYLRKTKKVMWQQNMTAQWVAYIQTLRTEHRRKIRLLEVLDSLAQDSNQVARSVSDKK